MRAPKSIKASRLISGDIYHRDGYTVFYSAGYYHFSTFEKDKQAKFKTIKEIINHIKSI